MQIKYIYILFLFINISIYSFSQTPTASFAKWRNNAKGAYSLIHDDFGDPVVHGITDFADTIAFHRGVVFTTGAITSECDDSDWATAKVFLSHGHEVMNHTHNHYCAYDPGWCETQTWGSYAIELDTSTQLIYRNLNVYPRFFIWPYDITTQASKDYLKNNLHYYGARGGTQNQSLDVSQLNDNTLTDFFSINFSVLGPGTSTSELNGLIDLAISNGKWGMREVHGVNDNSWASVPLNDYIAHCDYINAKMKSGDLWNATASQVTTYLLQTQNFVPTTSYDATNQVITVSFNDPGIDVSDLRSDVTLNVNPGGMSGFAYAYQGSTPLSVVNHGTYISINCYPHKGDITIYKFDPLVLPPGNFVSYENMVKKGQQGVIYSVPDMPNYTFIWSYSGTGATFNSSSNSVEINFTDNATSGTLSVKSSNPNGTSDPRTIDITVLDVSDVSRCGSGSVTMTINGPAGNYEWYDAPSGGTLLKSGSSYSTSLTQTDTFYIDKAVSNVTTVIGRTSMGSSWGGSVNSYAQKFTVKKQLVLNSISVSIPGWTSGKVYFVLLGSNGSTVITQSSPVTVSAGSTKTIALNFNISPGTYYLAARGTITDIEIASPNTTNAVIDNIIELEGNAYTGTNYADIDEGDFGFAIKWNITYEPNSTLTRVPVIAAINSNASIPGNFTQKTTTVCPGQNNVIYTVPDIAGTTFNWSYAGSGFNISSGQGTHSIVVDFDNNASAGTIQVTASNSCSTSGAKSLSLSLNSAPSQPSAISGSSSVCASSSTQTYSVTNVTNVTYAWSVNPSNVATITGTGNSVSIKWSGSGIVSCTPSNNCGDGQARTLSVNYSDIPTQPSAITGSSSVCASSSTQAYSVTNVTNVTYTWDVNPSTAATITGTGNAVSVTWKGSGTLSCTPSNACGDGPMRTLSVSYSDIPSQPLAISGSSSVCASSSTQTYSVTNVTNVNYAWSVNPSNAATITGTGNSVSVTWKGSGTLSCTPSNNCGNGLARTLSVSYSDIPLQPSSISGNSTVCASSATQNYSVTNVSNVTYTWSVNPSSAAKITGTGNTVSVTWKGSGTLSCTPSNNCGNGLSRTLSVSYSDIPSQPSSISGNSTVCASSATQNYSVTNVANEVFNWSVTPSNAATITGTGNTVSVTWNASGTLSCLLSNNCGNGPARTLDVTFTDALTQPVIAGSNSVCVAAPTQAYSIESASNVTYTWGVNPSGAAAIVGSGNSVSVTWNASGTLFCIPYNSCGQGAPGSLSVALKDIPAQPGAYILADSSVAKGTSGVNYSVPSEVDNSYLWSYSGNGIAIHTSSNHSNKISMDFYNDATSGILSVTAYNQCGYSSTSRDLEIHVHTAMPGDFVIYTNPVTQGQTGVVYSVPQVDGVTYSWTYTGDGGTINGTGSTITMDFSKDATSGKLIVVANDGSGVSEGRELLITVTPLTVVSASWEGANMEVFPNPIESTSILTLNINYASEFCIEVYNMLGLKVGTLIENKNLTPGEYSFPINDFSPGTYIVRLKSGKQEKYLKVIRN